MEIAEERPEPDELLDLYGSVGWAAYTGDPETLGAAVRGSHLVLTVRDDDSALVGLVRTISDGATIVYVQDLLVHPSHQRTGIGGALLDAVLERYEGVRQTVLMTDAELGQRAFYESRGFVETHDVLPAPLRSFVMVR